MAVHYAPGWFLIKKELIEPFPIQAFGSQKWKKFHLGIQCWHMRERNLEVPHIRSQGQGLPLQKIINLA